MNVLITGGAGYIGHELTKALLMLPSVKNITIYDTFLRANYQSLHEFIKEPRVHFIHGDILDEAKLTKALKNMDVVCHLAAIVRAPFNEEFTHLFEQTNHWGTASLCSALEAHTVSKLIYLSSAAVYGTANKPFAISDEPNPITSYGHAKLNGEKQLERIKSRIKVTILRSGDVFGHSPTMHHDSVINRFNLAMAFNEPLLVHGCGNQIRAYIHVERVIKSICYFLSEDYHSDLDLYNIYDFNMSINEILQSYQHLALEFEVINVSQNQRLGDLSLAGNESLHNFIGEPHDLNTYLQKSLIKE